jgi:hypothetical protein
VTTLAPDTLRRVNQQRIDALRDQVHARNEDHRDDAADERAHYREETATEDYRRDDDEQLDEDTDFHSGLGY